MVRIRTHVAGPIATPLYAQLGSDHHTRNAFNNGSVNGGLGLGVRL